MTSAADFPQPTREAHALTFKIVEALSGVLRDEDARVAADAMVFSSAILLLACVKPSSSARVLREAADILKRMARHPRHLEVIKRTMQTQSSEAVQ